MGSNDVRIGAHFALMNDMTFGVDDAETHGTRRYIETSEVFAHHRFPHMEIPVFPLTRAASLLANATISVVTGVHGPPHSLSRTLLKETNVSFSTTALSGSYAAHSDIG